MGGPFGKTFTLILVLMERSVKPCGDRGREEVLSAYSGKKRRNGSPPCRKRHPSYQLGDKLGVGVVLARKQRFGTSAQSRLRSKSSGPGGRKDMPSRHLQEQNMQRQVNLGDWEKAKKVSYSSKEERAHEASGVKGSN